MRKRLPFVLVLATLGLVALAAPAQAIVISEFRLRGPAADNDEFIELANETSSPVTVSTTDGSAGWAVAATSGGVRFVVPNGTVIPPLGHYLGINSSTNALGSADATWTADIPGNTGLALFKTATPANFSLATRLDAVGSTTEANALYKEGAGYPAINASFSIDHAFTRDLNARGVPKDTNNNAADFLFVDTNGTSAGAGQRLGAPSPQGFMSPLGAFSPTVEISPLDPAVSVNATPNTVVDPTSDPPSNATFGRLYLRRYIRNASFTPITALQFEISDINTFPSPSGIADLRPIDAATANVATSAGTVSVTGVKLVQPPRQANGGGFGSIMRIALGQPLAPGARIPVAFVMGIQQTGTWRFCAHAEGLPATGGTISATGNMGAGAAPAALCSAVTGAFPSPPAEPTPPAPQTTTVDLPRTAPLMTLALASKSTPASLSIKVSCPASFHGACAGTLRATAKPGKKTLKLGSVEFVLASGKSRTLVLKPSAAVRRALRKAKRPKLKLAVTVLGDNGTSRKSTKTVTLKT
jgi:lamin tail-like protein